MNPKLQAYLEKAKEERRKQELEKRNAFLISLGLIDEEKSIIKWSKTFRDSEDNSEYPNYDEKKDMYYRGTKVAIEVSDEEYAELLRLNPQKAPEIKELSRSAESLLGTLNSLFLLVGVAIAIILVIMGFSNSQLIMVIYGVVILISVLVYWAACRVFLNISNSLFNIEQNQRKMMQQMKK